VAHRTFTPSEANSALERLRPLAERMVELAARAGAMASERVASEQKASGNGHRSSGGRGEESRAVLGELEHCLGELSALGVEVKDIGSGLVDFPALHEGEEVLLCWRVGEPTVSWWHRREDGFAGRRRIDWDDGD
jgi:hypothetical protein